MARFFIAAFLLLNTAAHAADDRAADRAAIRAHIDRIFQAFIHKDSAELRAKEVLVMTVLVTPFTFVLVAPHPVSCC